MHNGISWKGKTDDRNREAILVESTVARMLTRSRVAWAFTLVPRWGSQHHSNTPLGYRPKPHARIEAWATRFSTRKTPRPLDTQRAFIEATPWPGGPRRLLAPGSHRSVRARIRAYGSSHQTFASRCRTTECTTRNGGSGNDSSSRLNLPQSSFRLRCRRLSQRRHAR